MYKPYQLAEPVGRVFDAVEEMRIECRSNAAQAIEDGWYSEKAADRLDDIVTIPVYVASNTRGTSLQHALAEFDESGGFVAVKEPWLGDGWIRAGATVSLMHSVLPHEYGHVIAPGSSLTSPFDHGELLFDEFIANLAEDIHGGSNEIPNKRLQISGINKDPYTEVVRAYCELADAPRDRIDLQEFTRAATGSGREMSDLHEHLNDGWGINGTLQALHDEADSYYRGLPVRMQDKGVAAEKTGKFMRRVIKRWRRDVATS